MILQTYNLQIHIKQKLICENLSLCIEPGDFCGLLGPNGSGKTTLLHTLAGLHKATQGSIHLSEKPLSSYRRKDIAKKMALLFQDTFFAFPQTVFDFCLDARYPHKNSTIENKKIICDILQAMELTSFEKQNIQTLSGGEKRRLAIAAALAQTPEIYLLDEPTNHLDTRYQLHVLNHFKTLTEERGASVIMAIHDINLVQQFCNKIILLFPDGTIIQKKAADALSRANVFDIL